MEELRASVRLMNDSVWEFYRPTGPPRMQVIFFHGLHLKDSVDSFLSTWTSGDGSTLWPATWLVEDFPRAEIFGISYRAGEGVVGIDLRFLAENILVDLIDAGIGQIPNCPCVLVGHSFGGLVIKKICLQAHQESIMGGRAKLTTFLNNLRAIFFYSTPHHGMNPGAVGIDRHTSRIINLLRPMNVQTERLNHDFDNVCQIYNWKTAGLGESLPSNLGLFKNVVIVPEASSRDGGDFYVVPADHFTISRPTDKTSPSFFRLRDFLINIADNTESIPLPGNFQYPPKKKIVIDKQLEMIVSMLRDERLLGIFGMKGIGKTTLAGEVFNRMNQSFEYSCFVPKVKNLEGDVETVKQKIWEHMFHHGKRVEDNANWSSIANKSLLLVLDDVSGEHARELLSHLVREYNGAAQNSRLIVTSCDRGLSTYVDDRVHEVSRLDESDARKLFLAHAFPTEKEPSEKVEKLVISIVEKCDGLPLALVLLGTHLQTKTVRYDYWRQTLNELNKGEFKILFEILRQSYNELQDDAAGKIAQLIFLDSTMFFYNNTNWTLREVKVAWNKIHVELANLPWQGLVDSSLDYPAIEDGLANLSWQKLVDTSLVYNVNEDENIKVHALLQSLGRKIALESQNYGKWRVWDEETAYQSDTVLDEQEILALRLKVKDKEGQGLIYINHAVFLRLKELRFLEANVPVVVEGNVDLNSSLTKLVLLKFPGRQIGQVLFNPSLQTRLVVLKVFDSRAPDFLRFASFHTLPKGFFKLSALKFLQFDSCHELQTLTESFGDLKALEHLEFRNCEALRALPQTFGELSKLSRLVFQGCSKLKFMPGTFRNLLALSHLQFEDCPKLMALPSFFDKLCALKSLHIDGCEALQDLPTCFGKLPALNHLTIVNCQKLTSLPHSFTNLVTLDILRVVNCKNLKPLPESLKQFVSGLPRSTFDPHGENEDSN